MSLSYNSIFLKYIVNFLQNLLVRMNMVTLIIQKKIIVLKIIQEREDLLYIKV